MKNIIDLSVILGLSDKLKAPLQKAENNVSKASERMNKRLKLSMKLAGAGAAAGGVAFGAKKLITSFTDSIMELSKAQGELATLGVENIDIVTRKGQEMQKKFAGVTSAAFVRASYDIKSGISSLSDEGVARMTAAAVAVAKATKGVPEQMTSLFATSYGIFKRQFADMEDGDFGDMFGAVLAKSVQQFKTDGGKMQQAIESAGAGAANLGMSLNEQLTVLGMMQQQMQAGEAGTALKAFASKAYEAHVAFQELASETKNKVRVRLIDENGQLRAMPDILADLKKRYGETLEAAEADEIKKAFGTDEAMKMINALYGKEKAVRANEAALSDAADQGAAFTEEMAKTADDNFASKMAILTQNFDVLKQLIGEQLAPTVEAFAKKIKAITEKLQAFAEKNPELVKKIGKVVAIIGSIAAVAAPVLIGIAAIISVWSILSKVMLASPIVLIIAGIAYAAYLIYKNWDGISAWFSDLWESIKSGISTAWEFIKNIFLNYTPAGLIITHWDSISAWFSDLWESIKSGISIAWDAIKNIFFNYTPQGLIITHWDTIVEWFGQLWDRVKSTFTQKWQAIKSVVAAWKDDIKQKGMDIVQGLLDGITAKWNAVKEKIKGLAGMLPNWLKKRLGIQSPSRVFMGLGNNIGEGLAIGIDKQQANVMQSVKKMGANIVKPIAASTVLSAAAIGSPAAASGPDAYNMTQAPSGITYSPNVNITLSIGGDSTLDTPHIEAMIRRALAQHDEQAQSNLRRLLND